MNLIINLLYFAGVFVLISSTILASEAFKMIDMFGLILFTILQIISVIMLLTALILDDEVNQNN